MGTCERHGLAQGPEGRCIVCRRELRAKLAGLPPDERRLRVAVRLGIAVLAGIAAFALILALMDTSKHGGGGGSPQPAEAEAPLER